MIKDHLGPCSVSYSVLDSFLLQLLFKTSYGLGPKQISCSLLYFSISFMFVISFCLFLTNPSVVLDV